MPTARNKGRVPDAVPLATGPRPSVRLRFGTFPAPDVAPSFAAAGGGGGASSNTGTVSSTTTTTPQAGHRAFVPTADRGAFRFFPQLQATVIGTEDAGSGTERRLPQ